jgi:hypothetical protein
LSEFAQLTIGFTGSKLEASVQSALIDSYNDGARNPAPADLAKAIRATVPLSKTMVDRIEALRTFYKSGRAIPAGGTLEDDAMRATQPASLQL